MELEKRSVNISNLEVRSRGSKDILEGYAALFNQRTNIGGIFYEELKAGCFSKALDRDDLDCRALINHDNNKVLARKKAGRNNNTLKLREDNIGLWFKIDPLPDTQESKDLVKNIELGNIDQCSFGFIVSSENWLDIGEDEHLREIEEVEELFDISVCTYPAYSQTDVKVASRAKRMTGKQANLSSLNLKQKELNLIKRKVSI